MERTERIDELRDAMAELSRSGEKVSITGPGPYGVIQTFSPLDWNGEKRFLQTMYVIDDDCLEAAAKVEKWTPAAIEEAMEKGMFMDCGTANVTQDDPVDPFIIHEVKERMIGRGELPADFWDNLECNK